MSSLNIGHSTNPGNIQFPIKALEHHPRCDSSNEPVILSEAIPDVGLVEAVEGASKELLGVLDGSVGFFKNSIGVLVRKWRGLEVTKKDIIEVLWGALDWGLTAFGCPGCCWCLRKFLDSLKIS